MLLFMLDECAAVYVRRQIFHKLTQALIARKQQSKCLKPLAFHTLWSFTHLYVVSKSLFVATECLVASGYKEGRTLET